MSSIDLFLSRDWAVGAGPAVEAANPAAPVAEVVAVVVAGPLVDALVVAAEGAG